MIGSSSKSLVVVIGLCAACDFASVALAQEPAAQAGEAGRGDAAQERSQSFQAVRGAVKEDVAGGPLLLTAYAAIWIVLLLYVIRLVRLQQRVQSDVARLEQVLASAPSSSQSTTPR